MALVHNNFGDFVLFSREQSYLDMPDLRPDGSYPNYQYDPSLELQQSFDDITSSTFDPYQSHPSYALMEPSFYGAPQLMADDSKHNLGQVPQSYAPVASPPISMAQSLDQLPSRLSRTSGVSGQSTASSTIGSPYSHTTQSLPGQDQWFNSQSGLCIAPDFVHTDAFAYDSSFPVQCEESGQVSFEIDKYSGSSVDPSLIQPFETPIQQTSSITPYPSYIRAFQPPLHIFQPPSPVLSDTSSHGSHRKGSERFRSRRASPYLHSLSYQPYPPLPQQRRRPSVSSNHSRLTHDSPRSVSVGFDEDGKERDRCPIPDCRRLVKDLKAHMLTHQTERPEKCPIMMCKYHHKGFARKYDKNRHTLTHYKGTLVCGFCAGSGSAAEKSFNRADVFKRHLTTVHGVEQQPPNGRKKSSGSSSSAKKLASYPPDATGRCSTCQVTFKDAQDLYEHLDDCVLKSLEQEDPCEAINERHLAGTAADKAVQETLNRHMLPAELAYNICDDATFDDEDENEEDRDRDGGDGGSSEPFVPNPRSGRGEIKATKRSSS